MIGRFRQGLQVISAWGRPVQDELAQQYLSPAEYRLYLQMPRADRQHHLRVLQDLLRQGQQHPSLLKAALLHDVGKTRFRFSLPEKTLVVLVKKFLPRHFTKWGAGEADGWKRPFVVSAQHPQWSAELAKAAGLDPLSIELIRRHQSYMEGTPQTEADRLLLLLQAADDRS
jgi:HD domain